MSVTIPEYDPEQAKQLLAAAGHPNGFTIKDFFISKSFAFPKVMTLVQEQLKKIGINVELHLVEHPTYHENIRKNLNPFVLYGGTRLTDGDIWLSLFFAAQEIPDPATGNKGTNFAHYMGIDDCSSRGVANAIRRSARNYIMRHSSASCVMLFVCPSSMCPSYSHVIPSGYRHPLTPSMGSFNYILITIIQKC